jgi:hypothetical protein
VGRGLQVTGILLCLADGQELGRCQCFVDLARTEFKQRVKQILVAAAYDWVNLALYPGRGQRGRTLGEVRHLRYRAEAQSEQSRTDLPPISRTDLPPISRTDLPPVSRTDFPPVRQRLDLGPRPSHPEIPPMREGSDVRSVWPRPDLNPNPVWRQGRAEG